MKFSSAKALFPDHCAVYSPKQAVIDAVRAYAPSCVAELGTYEGHTALELLRLPIGSLHLFDFDTRLDALKARIDPQETRVHYYPNTHEVYESYAQTLFAMLKAGDPLRFDFVYLDGAHTFAIDGLAFFMVDLFLKPGGLLFFDDLHWTIERSPTMAPDVFEPCTLLYSPRQRAEHAIGDIVEYILPHYGYRRLDKALYQKPAS